MDPNGPLSQCLSLTRPQIWRHSRENDKLAGGQRLHGVDSTVPVSMDQLASQSPTSTLQALRYVRQSRFIPPSEANSFSQS